MPDASTALTFRDQCLAIVCPKYLSLASVIMAELRRKANVCRPALEDLPESMPVIHKYIHIHISIIIY